MCLSGSMYKLDTACNLSHDVPDVKHLPTSEDDTQRTGILSLVIERDVLSDVAVEIALAQFHVDEIILEMRIG